jgi:hypothetical protein
MSNIEMIYEKLFDGPSEEATKLFPFLVEGLYLRVIRAASRNIGIFPNGDSFYVVTYRSAGQSKWHAIIEKTNSVTMLNVIVQRETFGGMYLDENDLPKIKAFLEENCQNIILTLAS